MVSPSADALFPNGPWVGFYNYGDGSERHRMDLSLRFHGGHLDGSGSDDIAPFTIRGHYRRDAEAPVVTWNKKYLTHVVWYRGFSDHRGIWGTWEIGSSRRGGFRIWPKGMGDDVYERVSAEAEPPATVQGAPSTSRSATTGR